MLQLARLSRVLGEVALPSVASISRRAKSPPMPTRMISDWSRPRTQARHARDSSARRSGVRGALLSALVLTALATPLGAAPLAWTQARTGSWAIVEAWKHVLGEPKVSRVTTTLVRNDGGTIWFRHIDESGRVWEDHEPGEALAGDGAFEPGGEDRFMTRQELSLGGVRVPCRVIMNEKRTSWGDEHAVRGWTTRSKRWEAIDTTLRVRVLKVLDLGSVIEYRDGRIVRAPGLSMQTVKSLHEPVRVHGRTYDCWVRVTKTLHPDSSFAGRTTVWGNEQAPNGWVRRLHETRDARNGAMAREQEQLVDFRMQ